MAKIKSRVGNMRLFLLNFLPELLAVYDFIANNKGDRNALFVCDSCGETITGVTTFDSHWRNRFHIEDVNAVRT